MATVKNWKFEAIGTTWQVQVATDMTAAEWTALQRRVTARIAEFDATYSRFRTDSFVSQLAKRPGTYPLPPDGFALVQFYERLYTVTGGKLTPLIGDVMAAAGYDATYSLRPGALQSPPAWEAVLSYDRQTVTLKTAALLDFGAAGKGYLVDIVGDLLEAAGITRYFINAGGDIRCRGGRPLIVGMENPRDASEAIGTVELRDQSLGASAGSKRAWGGFHHIIDPSSLQSPAHIIATWVIAEDTMMADGLATALYFTEAAVLRKRFTFSYALLHDDMSLEHSDGFPATIFTSEAA